MSDLSNNLAILSYLKDKVHKWRNISILLVAICVVLMARVIVGGDISDKIELSDEYVAKIEISGPIFENDYRSKVLKDLEEDESAKALIVKVNSPGGSMVGSEILYSELRNIAKNKPIVVLMNSIAASGGYMASLASDHIIAHNGTITGSIGVLLQSAEMVNLAKKLGVGFNTYKSAPLKAVPSPFEKSNQAVDKVINSSIQDSASFFYDLVKSRRGKKLAKASYTKAFDGRIFTGRQAVKIGLVDQIGNFDSAVKHLQEKYKIDTDKIKKVELSKPSKSILDKLSASFPGLNQAQSSNKIMAILPF